METGCWVSVQRILLNLYTALISVYRDRSNSLEQELPRGSVSTAVLMTEREQQHLHACNVLQFTPGVESLCITTCFRSIGFVHAMRDSLPQGLRGLKLHQGWLLELLLLACHWALH